MISRRFFVPSTFSSNSDSDWNAAGMFNPKIRLLINRVLDALINYHQQVYLAPIRNSMQKLYEGHLYCGNIIEMLQIPAFN
jgi:hypothetical protein